MKSIVSINLTDDKDRKITMEYNHLNLPTRIDFTGTSKYIKFLYDADGNKLSKKVYDNTTLLEERDYISGMEFVDGTIESIYHSEGRVLNANGTNPKYEYALKDHLGNTRITYIDQNSNGKIETPSEITWEGHYYPFGMEMEGPWMSGSAEEIKYKYNGIEKVEDHGLDVNMATFRTLDPAAGVWWSVDPKAEALASMSPYNAMGNNPVSNMDPEGDFFFSDIGYNTQKLISPFAVKFNLNPSNPGIEASVGIPQIIPGSVRYHFGNSYGFGAYDGGVNGHASWYGTEVSYAFSLATLSSTKYISSGVDGTSTSQSLGGAKFGLPFAYIKYQNDWQPELFRGLAPGSFGDEGDRWRTAAVQLNVGGVKAGINLFTGDPGLVAKFRDGEEGTGLHFDKTVYTTGSPNKYRVGNIYWGVGSIRRNFNNELNRHVIQNKFAHDYLQDSDAKHFQIMNFRFNRYWSFNNGYGTGLW